METGPMASGDLELFSEVLKLTTKIFYVDVKQNNRGVYLKISEKGRFRSKSSVVIPVQGCGRFIQLFDHYTSESDQGRLGQPRDLVVEGKVFAFSAGENDRGRFLRIYESGGGRYPAGGSSLMIPCGFGNSNMRTFRDCLARIEMFLAQEGEAVDTQGALAMPAATSEGAVLELSNNGSPVLSIGSKHFFFELRSNDRGSYLKIKEVAGNLKNLLVVPVAALPKFQEALSLAMMSRPIMDSSHSGGHPAMPRPLV